MHFLCSCGNVISDTTDNLPYSAHVVADVDIEDYWEAWERKGRGQDLGNLKYPMDYEKIIYQCEECGRLFFDDPDDPIRFVSFLPEDKNVMVTGPIEGAKWKGYIYGFSDLGMKRSIGACFTTWNNGAQVEEHSFDSYEAMRAYFDSKVEELRAKDLLRSAWINKDGETVFSWSLDDSSSVQEKHEIYLSEKERAALAEFHRDHADCCNKYPRGAKGWSYAYEILPGVCGADDRDLKATCLRCGATIESIDGKIIHKEGHRAREDTADKTDEAILDLLHRRGIRTVRSETISMPERYYEVAEAVGYVRGLVDAAKMLNPDTPLPEIFKFGISRILDDAHLEGKTKLKNLIRRACGEEGFDWVLEEGLESLKAVLREQYPNIKPDWIEEPKKKRSASFQPSE